MPQTSPMNWIILSLTMITSITYTMLNFSEKINNKSSKKPSHIVTLQSWSW